MSFYSTSYSPPPKLSSCSWSGPQLFLCFSVSVGSPYHVSRTDRHHRRKLEEASLSTAAASVTGSRQGWNLTVDRPPSVRLCVVRRSVRRSGRSVGLCVGPSGRRFVGRRGQARRGGASNRCYPGDQRGSRAKGRHPDAFEVAWRVPVTAGRGREGG